MSRLVLRSSVVSAGGDEAITGLDFNGDPPGRRQIIWTDGAEPTPHPLTVLLKNFQRQNSARADGSSYYCSFFWGNDGAFDWGAGYGRSYYGAHPYPSQGHVKWEISTSQNDFRGLGDTANDGSEAPDVTFDAQYSQAFIAENTGGSNYRYTFYANLPDVTTTYRIRVTDANWNAPPSPAFMIGQTSDNGSGKSWGGYDDWEEQNAILRGFQIYSAALSTTHIAALGDLDTDAEVLAYCAANSITSLWYLCMNPTPSDITDKSGAGHHPAWSGASRPTLWEG